MAENLSTTNYPIIYTPQEVLSIFREQLRTPAKVVVLEGIYYQNPRSGNYGGYFYDVLRGQNDTFEIRVIVPLAIREKLSSGTLVQLAGTISKEVRNQSIIATTIIAVTFGEIFIGIPECRFITRKYPFS